MANKIYVLFDISIINRRRKKHFFLILCTYIHYTIFIYLIKLSLNKYIHCWGQITPQELNPCDSTDSFSHIFSTSLPILVKHTSQINAVIFTSSDSAKFSDKNFDHKLFVVLWSQRRLCILYNCDPTNKINRIIRKLKLYEIQENKKLFLKAFIWFNFKNNIILHDNIWTIYFCYKI